MGELRLTLLGRPQVICDDTPLTGWALQKSLALLAYLAVTGRPHSRGALAGLLWPDCTEANARSSLRKVLAELRQRVPSHLTITRAEVAFDRASAYWLDVEAFERGIGRALALRESPVSRAGAAALVEAIELYRGDFLAGLDVHRAPAFEEWLLLEREHLRSLALRALHALVDHHAARAQPDADPCLPRPPAGAGAGARGSAPAQDVAAGPPWATGGRAAPVRGLPPGRASVGRRAGRGDHGPVRAHPHRRRAATLWVHAPSRVPGPQPACPADPPGWARSRAGRDPGPPAGSGLPAADPGRSWGRGQDPFGAGGSGRRMSASPTALQTASTWSVWAPCQRWRPSCPPSPRPWICPCRRERTPSSRSRTT